MNQLVKRVALDSLGVFLIIIAVPISWLPGPGGIPLALIGLGLLAKNNKWAHDLMNNFEAKARHYSDLLIHANPRLRLALDGVGLLAVALGAYLALQAGGLLRVVGAAAVTSGAILLVLNRGRGLKIYNKLARKKT